MSDFYITSEEGVKAFVRTATPASYVVQQARSSEFRVDGALRGPKGDTGATGAQGPQGIQGIQGPQGPAGGGGTTIDQTARDAAAAAQATADSKQDAMANAATLAKVTESAGLPLWDGAAWPGGGSGGTGTVTSVSVTPSNGITGSVATASTTPAITLSLGAITPESVAATGTVTGSNLSGTNTGDQTNVTGNAGTATKLATARTINGVSFDGSANITIPAAAGTLTGSTLASGVTASSLTSAAGGSFGTAAFTAASAYDPAGAAAAITLSGLGGVPTTRTVNGHALSGNVTVTAGDVGLSNVENTAISTWTGSSNLSTVGTISSGTWHGTAIADTYISSAAEWNAKVSFPGFGTTGTTACVGNDSRLSDARTPVAHNQAWSTISATPTTLAGYGIADAQPLDSDLTAISALATTAYGRSLLTPSDAASARTLLGISAGSGDVSGPASSADNAIARFDGTGGKTLQNSGVYISDSGNLGIGTTNPAATLDVAGSGRFGEATNPDTAYSNGLSVVRPSGTSTSILLWQVGKGLGHVGFKANDSTLYVVNSSAGGTIANGKGIVIDTIGNVRLNAYGAGTLVTDSSGNVTALAGQQNVSTTSTPTFASMTLAPGSGQYPTGLTIQASTHATSRRAGFALGNWMAMQDPSGNGTQSFALYDTAASATRLSIDTSGNVGIGTNAPGGVLDVAKPSGGRVQVLSEGANTYNVIASRNAADSAYLPLTVKTSGIALIAVDGVAVSNSLNAGGDLVSATGVRYVNGSIHNALGTDGVGGLVGTISNHTLAVWVNGAPRITVSTAGAVRFHNYGAGTLVTDSSGNITTSSDRRLKNVSGKFTRGLAAIMEIQPKVFTWKPESWMNPDDVNVGFIAQDVQPAIPEAVGTDPRGMLTISDRPLIAALVNAVKELKSENDELRNRIDKLEAKK